MWVVHAKSDRQNMSRRNTSMILIRDTVVSNTAVNLDLCYESMTMSMCRPAGLVMLLFKGQTCSLRWKAQIGDILTMGKAICIVLSANNRPNFAYSKCIDLEEMCSLFVLCQRCSFLHKSLRRVSVGPLAFCFKIETICARHHLELEFREVRPQMHVCCTSLNHHMHIRLMVDVDYTAVFVFNLWASLATSLKLS